MRRPLFYLLLWSVFSAVESFAQTKIPEGYAQYCNPVYGYCVNYPTALLLPGPVADNGDGRTFTAKSGKARLAVYATGSWTFSPDMDVPLTLRQIYDRELKGGRFPDSNARRVITYHRFGSGYFVLSGTEKGRIFYQKFISLADDRVGIAYLTYTPAERGKYDAVAAEIFRSFR